MNSALAALLAAFLFGLSTPFAKQLLGEVEPLLLAGILYLGSGLGLYAWRLASRGLSPGSERRSGFSGEQWRWLIGAIAVGGVLAPVLLLYGLRATPAATASLLLNLEGVFTALLAAALFGEHLGRRIALGLVCIVGGGIALSWTPGAPFHVSLGALGVVGACLAWALDNNLTRRIATADAVHLAAIKGLAAGTVNTVLAVTVGVALPSPAAVLGGLLVGALGYGASLALFVLALRGLGAARTSGYFSTAPFVGAAVAVLWFDEPVGIRFLLAAGLMALGVWLHLSERHDHAHVHEALVHDHLHRHDDGHHEHEHDFPWDGRSPHAHPHRHEPTTHAHPHYPDAHHRHRH